MPDEIDEMLCAIRDVGLRADQHDAEQRVLARLRDELAAAEDEKNASAAAPTSLAGGPERPARSGPLEATRARWPTRRVGVGMVVAAALSVGGIAVAATQVIEIGKDAAATPPSAVKLQESTAATRTPEQPDPRGGPPWTTVEFRTNDGRWCAKPGRLVGDRVGSLDANGGVIGTSLKEGGDCVDVTKLSADAPLAWHLSSEAGDPRTGSREPISYVWGLARPGITSVNVSTASLARTVNVSTGRAFIAVLPGNLMTESVTIRALGPNGATTVVMLPSATNTANTRDLFKDPPTPAELAAADGR